MVRFLSIIPVLLYTGMFVCTGAVSRNHGLPVDTRTRPAGDSIPRYARRVNTLIGTQGKGLAAGYTYPGATYPFGMVQFTRSYFSPQSGFVVNQLSGAGCGHMGNFPLLPLKGVLTVSPDSIINLRAGIGKEKGTAGYYEATVNDDITARMTVTQRTGMAMFSYPAGEQRGTIIIGGGVAATPIKAASIVISSPHSCEGYAEGGSFCGIATPYKVYLVAEFDEDALSTGTWKDDRLNGRSGFSEGAHSGVYFTFDVSAHKTIGYKVGISYVSVDNARENLRLENAGWDFEQIRRQAEARWDDYLGRIAVRDDKPDTKSTPAGDAGPARMEQFYTHLYHALIHPNICTDVNGEYMGADNKIHTADRSVYTSFSNWDTYRTQIQLLSMLAPDVASDVVVSHALFAAQSGGGFPRWVMANVETGIMQGDPTPILIANAYAFGARNYDSRSLLDIMRRGAEDPSAHAQNQLTRPGLREYLDKGWYKASMQLEYASADFAIGQFALQACNNEITGNNYLRRAQYWRNLYNPERKWLQSRNPDGSWKRYDEDWREATYKNYFWMVPFDLKGLIDTIGGKAIAEKRLDSLFTRLDAGYGDDWFASGNEPSFNEPWIYNWAGAPWKTQAIVRRILNEQYLDRPDGLPGNDDLGAMGAYYVFSCLGLYPEIPGIGGFSINSPLFPDITLHLPNGDVRILGGDDKKPYIQSLRLNGRPYNSTWISWDDLEKGAALQFRLGERPDKSWGTQAEPPSFGQAGPSPFAQASPSPSTQVRPGTSPFLGPFVRPDNINPILAPDTNRFYDPMSGAFVGWEASDVFNPAAVERDGKICVLYRAEDNSAVGIGSRTSRIGLAVSTDGLRMQRRSTPVLFPAEDDQKNNEWRGGCEDPRVAETAGGVYVLLYTQWNRKLPRLAVATSRDLVHWHKYGPAFWDAYGGKFAGIPTKSASIVTRVAGNRLRITKVNGAYWMYWGEAAVYAATSTDCIHWTPLVETDGSLKKLISPRKGYFDSRLTECGPPAVLTDKGIVLIYNGKNSDGPDGDNRYAAGSYCAGQVLFDAKDPARPIARLDRPFFQPEASFEKSGQYPEGTVFAEGLVYHKDKWFLYYGCADSRVGVAVFSPPAASANR